MSHTDPVAEALFLVREEPNYVDEYALSDAAITLADALDALALCVAQGWTDESIDRERYENDSLYHAIVYGMRSALDQAERRNA